MSLRGRGAGEGGGAGGAAGEGGRGPLLELGLRVLGEEEESCAKTVPAFAGLAARVFSGGSPTDGPSRKVPTPPPACKTEAFNGLTVYIHLCPNSWQLAPRSVFCRGWSCRRLELICVVVLAFVRRNVGKALSLRLEVGRQFILAEVWDEMEFRWCGRHNGLVLQGINRDCMVGFLLHEIQIPPKRFCDRSLEDFLWRSGWRNHAQGRRTP